MKTRNFGEKKNKKNQFHKLSLLSNLILILYIR